MDFVEDLPNFEGFNSIWVAVDKLTKYSHIAPLKHPYTIHDISNLFLKHIFKLHSLPLSIVSDRDKTFTSQFWQELFHLQGVQMAISTAYHLETDGHTEVINKTLENYLRCFLRDRPRDGILDTIGRVVVQFHSTLINLSYTIRVFIWLPPSPLVRIYTWNC